ncbi:DUF3843 family protein [Ancylomarina euxinus]|uniref:DUF3843 family protein n=1 Tax=Ancylomarina euxinus TaxID=2283627 RepID=A0A425Y2C1_9BACT|nr:DUF3843 family protein [Ancylomarina euxinus]MCZ4694874.1 DUF3843 family protein [Ancylomarina euxinus]MUP14740.1 DUF3843 family protein [Ancylomarina euxinus]RRG22087.1 DUF3843 family protein [Ancylomarina euxinus]
MHNNDITIEDWLLLKPYNEEVLSDSCYINLANQFKDVLIEDLYFTEDNAMQDEDATEFACLLASFVEDIVSETHIYHTFKRQHKELYGHAVPFSSEGYDEDASINSSDIQFLVWYYLSVKQPDTIIYLSSFFIAILIDQLIDVVKDESTDYEVNEDLKKYYSLAHEACHINHIRDLIDNILFRTYLFYPDSFNRLANFEEIILAEDFSDMSPEHAADTRNANLFENRYHFIWHYRTRLLALNGKEWLASLIGKAHPLYQDVLNISKSIRAAFIYKSEDENNLIVEHIASGRRFEITKQSITPKMGLIPNESILYLSINQWQDKWWNSGIVLYQNFDADFILDEKASEEEKLKVAFLDADTQRTEIEELEKQKKHFISFNKNSPIAFMPSKELSKFVSDFGSYYRKCENIKLPEGVGDIKIEIGEKELNEFNKRWTEAFVFINSQQGMEISYNFVDIIPDENNPFYKAEKLRDKFWNVIISKHASKELTHYFFDQYKEQLSGLSSEFDAVFAPNLDFLTRFWKHDIYFSETE